MLGQEKVAVHSFLDPIILVTVIPVDRKQDVSSLPAGPGFAAVNRENPEERSLVSLGPLEKGPGKIPLSVIGFLVMRVSEEGPEDRPGDSPGGLGGNIERPHHLDLSGVVGIQVPLLKMKNGPEEKGLLVVIFLPFMPNEWPDLKSLFAASVVITKNGPKKAVGFALPLPGTGIKGPKEEVHFIPPKAILQFPIKGEKTSVRLSLVRFPPDGQEEISFLLLGRFGGQVPAVGIDEMEVGVYPLLRPFVSSHGVQVVQAVPIRLCPRVEQRAEGHILSPRILPISKKGA
jgi:hypothetical protein